ncbi:MAG: restriction endonuclease subunit S [Candidatus Methanomethylophilaceae archaeon]|nr:restriction endonuclease subunit S [Candidatus Methanomethylophilaceae archaeon]
MSDFNELIKKLRPDDIKYISIKEAYRRVKGTPITATKMKEIASPEGDILIIAGGKTTIYAKEEDIPRANITREPAVLVQSRGIIDVIYYDKPFTFKNEMWAYTSDNPTNVKYLYYVMKRNIEYFRNSASGMGSLPQISLSVTEDYVIPYPPVEIQEEIVRILDSFTALTAELTAELTARKRQYEFYRDKLLSFDHLTPEERERAGVRWMTLEDLFIFKNGLNKGKEFFGAGTPIVNFKDVYNNNRLTSKILCGRVTVNESERVRFDVQKGDVFFTRTSETKEDIGVASVLVEDVDDCVFSGFVLRARPKTNLLIPEYCSYCFASSDVRKEIVKHSTYTTRALTSGSALSKIRIPVPNKETQSRITSILDNMNDLCNDRYAGIPAEIEARRKQYEYYRDRVLSFKEASI